MLTYLLFCDILRREKQPSPTLTMNEIEMTPALKNIFSAFCNYPYVLLEKMGLKDRIFLTENSQSVMGTIIGFISALWLTNQKELANTYADEFARCLEYACPKHEVDFPIPCHMGSRTIKMPSRVCEMHSDGSMMGFSLSWFVLAEEQQQQKDRITGREFRKFGLWEAKYAYQMNGGLLFHGSNQENFAVTIGKPSLWSIHT